MFPLAHKVPEPMNQYEANNGYTCVLVPTATVKVKKEIFEQ